MAGWFRCSTAACRIDWSLDLPYRGFRCRAHLATRRSIVAPSIIGIGVEQMRLGKGGRVEDGAIVGRQDPNRARALAASASATRCMAISNVVVRGAAGLAGGYGRFSSVPHNDQGIRGYQMLLDHRKSGNIGGYYGNGIGGFHAINFTVDAAGYDAGGNATGIRIEDPATTIEPMTADKPALLSHKASGADPCSGGRPGNGTCPGTRFASRRGVFAQAQPSGSTACRSPLDTATMGHPRTIRRRRVSAMRAEGAHRASRCTIMIRAWARPAGAGAPRVAGAMCGCANSRRK